MADPLYPWQSNRIAWSTRVQRLETGAQRLQGNVIRPTQGRYARIPIDALDVNNDVSLVTSRVKKLGGVPPTANIAGFAYTSTDSSITWYWDGTNGSHVIVIHRSDGSRFTVPTGGSGLTISGLTASTTYYFLPFWNTLNICNIGWVQGTVGSPQIAFLVADTVDTVNTPQYLIQQSSQSNEQLTAGFMTAATAAGGGSGGGQPGGGGAGGHCVMSGTEIVTVGGHDHSISVRGNVEWVHIVVADKRSLYCTFDHPLYHASRGKIEAGKLAEGDFIITDIGEQEIISTAWYRKKCSLWEVVMPKGHLFWANGFLSHNAKVQS